MKRVLCVYATRQIDSNLFMSSTIFRGLQEAGYETYMVFAGTNKVITDFKLKYSHYFKEVLYITITESYLKRTCDKLPVTKLGYSFYRHFIADGFTHLNLRGIKKSLSTYAIDCILSFIPPILSGKLAIDIKKSLGLNTVPLIQYWTDPLSLGRYDHVSQLSKTRIIHKYQESRLLKHSDRVIFCYPLLCEMEQKLHPQYAEKMSWSDISYMTRAENKKTVNNEKPLIGFFGAYQKKVRNIIPLIQTINELPQYNFIIRGDGDLDYDTTSIVNLNIKPNRLPLSEIEELESQCDILLSIGGRSGLTHPAGKTFYYASYNKPIIHIGDGINASYFMEYLRGFGDRFIHCYNNKESIEKAIKMAVELLPYFKLTIPERMNAGNIARKIIEE